MQAVAAAGPLMQLAGVATGTIGKPLEADTNSKLLDAQARNIQEQTDFDVRQFRRKSNIEAGSNIATAAASGVDITRGSPMFAQLDFAKQSEIEAQSIKRSGKMGYDSAKFQSRLVKQRIPFDIASNALGFFGDRRPGAAGPSILSMLAGK